MPAWPHSVGLPGQTAKLSRQESPHNEALHDAGKGPHARAHAGVRRRGGRHQGRHGQSVSDQLVSGVGRAVPTDLLPWRGRRPGLQLHLPQRRSLPQGLKNWLSKDPRQFIPRSVFRTWNMRRKATETAEWGWAQAMAQVRRVSRTWAAEKGAVGSHLQEQQRASSERPKAIRSIPRARHGPGNPGPNGRLIQARAGITGRSPPIERTFELSPGW